MLSRNGQSSLRFIPSNVQDKERFLDEYVESVDYRVLEICHTDAFALHAWVEKKQQPETTTTTTNHRHYLKFKFNGQIDRDEELSHYNRGDDLPSTLFHKLVHGCEFIVFSERWRVLIFEHTYTTDCLANSMIMRVDDKEDGNDDDVNIRAIEFLDNCLTLIETSARTVVDFHPNNINTQWKFIDAARVFDTTLCNDRNEWRSALRG